MTKTMPYVVTVGVDYSEVSALALREAFAIAAKHPPSELYVLHVERAVHPHLHAETNLPESLEEITERAVERVEKFIAREVATFREQPATLPPLASVFSHIRFGSPGAGLAQFAVDIGADLAVVGTHGRSGIARWLLGSVAHAVVTLAPCPVLVVREKKLRVPPRLAAPCPRCIEARQTGVRLWCEQHRTEHARPYPPTN